MLFKTMLFRQIALMCFWLLAAASLHAEPYLAMQQGLKCMQCHINPSGGGERSEFGEAFAQNVMPAEHVQTGDKVWTGRLNEFVGLGGNLRGSATWQKTRGQDSLSQFSLDQARVYISVAPIPDRLLVYVDELMAPGDAVNREAWVQLWSQNQTWYLKAGKMVLPFGWRFEDQNTFVGQVAGINMTTPDQGVEAGFERGDWDARLALTNGTSGGAESNNSKQVSTQLVYVRPRWRLGAGLNFNTLANGQIRSAALFSGLRTGSVVWLGEVDVVSAPNTVSATDSRTTQLATLLEADWLIQRGHNLKFTAEWSDPDRRTPGDTLNRFGIVYEWTPIQFLQVRGGWRQLRSQADVDALHQQLVFVQLHAFF